MASSKAYQLVMAIYPKNSSPIVMNRNLSKKDFDYAGNGFFTSDKIFYPDSSKMRYSRDDRSQKNWKDYSLWMERDGKLYFLGNYPDRLVDKIRPGSDDLKTLTITANGMVNDAIEAGQSTAT